MIVEKWLRYSGKMLFYHLETPRIIKINRLNRVCVDIVRILRTCTLCKNVCREPNYNLASQRKCQLSLAAFQHNITSQM